MPARLFATLAAVLVTTLLATVVPLPATAGTDGPGGPDSSSAAGQAPEPDTLAAPGTAATGRIGGDVDVIGAAIAISEATFAAGEATRAVIGRHDEFADSLAGSALAGDGAPLLYTTGGPDAPLDRRVVAELDRVVSTAVDCPPVHLLGGPGAVSSRAESDLVAAGYCPERIAGGARYETAIAVAEHVVATTTDRVDRVILARADVWADAATGGAYAAVSGTPILVTDPSTLHPRVAEFITANRVAEVTILGSGTAISPAVADAVAVLGPRVTRIAGAARDETATRIAADLWRARAGDTIVLVPGWADTAWAYALAGGVHSARLGAPQLYVATDGTVSPVNAAHLRAVEPRAVIAIGPAALVTDAMLTAAAGAPSLTAPSGPERPPRPPDDTFSYLAGHIVRFNPCEPIPWWFNPAGAPSWAKDDIDAAFGMLAAASGLNFSYQGTTTHTAVTGTPTGRGLIISFDDATTNPVWANLTAWGLGGASWRTSASGESQITSGWVTIRRDAGFSQGMVVGGLGPLMAHEIGHAIGLGHAAASDQIMSSTIRATTLGAGDRWALWHVGAGPGCIT